MNILYVDESGDPGTHEYSSPHFILSGLIVSQDHWGESLSKLKAFRKRINNKYHLNQREEIHAAELIRINKTKSYNNIKKTDRINLLKDYTSELPKIFNHSKVINVCININDHRDRDIFNLAWSRLFQRYDNYLKKEARDKGIVIVDDTDSNKLRNLLRKMRVYNPITSHYNSKPNNALIDNIIEDPMSTSSDLSYFIQSVDVIAHLLYRKEYPKGSLKKYGLEKEFDKLESILLKEASKNDEYGIVRK